MTQEEKDLLLRNLCARLPYGVKVDAFSYREPKTLCSIDIIRMEYRLDGNSNSENVFVKSGEIMFSNIKPYLRPMSSMTEDEIEELSHYENAVQRVDFYYSHHLDCRFMIDKGLALEAKEGMYKL